MATDQNPQNETEGKPTSNWRGAVEVEIASLIIDRTRLRPVDKATVEEYAALMEENGVTFFPPIEIVQVDDELNLVSGSHRIAAAKLIGETKFHARITNGDEDADIMIEAIARANLHGRARTPAEKRLAVHTLFGSAKWRARSDRAIARYCGVHHELVAAVRANPHAGATNGGTASSANPIENIEDRHQPARSVVGMDGKARDVSRQGAAAQRTQERERLVAAPTTEAEPAARAEPAAKADPSAKIMVDIRMLAADLKGERLATLIVEWIKARIEVSRAIGARADVMALLGGVEAARFSISAWLHSALDSQRVGVVKEAYDLILHKDERQRAIDQITGGGIVPVTLDAVDTRRIVGSTQEEIMDMMAVGWASLNPASWRSLKASWGWQVEALK